MDFIAAVSTATKHMGNADKAAELGEHELAARNAQLARDAVQRAIDAVAGDAPELADEQREILAKFNARHP